MFLFILCIKQVLLRLDAHDHETNFKASENMRAVMFENQRWHIMAGAWSTPLPVDRPTWSNGNGRRGCWDRPKFSENKNWYVAT
jgi:hypothetical protein